MAISICLTHVTFTDALANKSSEEYRTLTADVDSTVFVFLL